MAIVQRCQDGAAQVILPWKRSALCVMLWAVWIVPSVRAAPPSVLGGVAPRAEVSAILPTYVCRRAAGPIRIDGVLDDPGWRQSAVTKPFLNWNAQGIPEYPTSARLAWDDRCLYVAFQCKDIDIYSPYTRRDDPLYKYDVVEIFLSPDGYPYRYFEFEVSPANVLYDAKVFNPGSSGAGIKADKAWNAQGMRSAVRVDGRLNQHSGRDRGWTVEMAIPFADLGLAHAPAPGEVWRMNLYRYDPSAENRYAAWSPTLGERPDFHKPERFGYLEFAE